MSLFFSTDWKGVGSLVSSFWRGILVVFGLSSLLLPGTRGIFLVIFFATCGFSNLSIS